MTKRKIAIFTGNRAEYGLYFPILKAIASDPRLDYFLVVSGAHLKGDFGKTLDEIRNDGFRIHREVKVETADANLLGTAMSVGSCVTNLAPALAEIKPDLMIVYADRFESFAAMIASTQMGIPTAHIEGGDYTEGGALDDSVRHAMTKLAHLHFTTNEPAAERVRRLGEEPWRVHNVGSPALDCIAAGHFATPAQVNERFHLDPARPTLVFTQHSIATECERAAEQVRPSLAALNAAADELGAQVIITYPNDDAGGRAIIAEIEQFRATMHPRVQIHRNLGRHYYHGVLNIAKACLGNSSSGIKETAAFHCPCIDIGGRQRGRLRADNVLETPYDCQAIFGAIRTCLQDTAFQQQVQTCSNPYGAGDAGRRISDIIATVPLDLKLIQKKLTY